MATLTDYKGLDVVDGATGAGGIALTDNFKELADRAALRPTLGNALHSRPGKAPDSSISAFHCPKNLSGMVLSRRNLLNFNMIRNVTRKRD